MNKIIKQKNEEYIDIYETKLTNKTNFLSKMKVKNVVNDEVYAFNNNEEYLIKNDYLYLVYNSIALQDKFESNLDYTAVFITNTLISEFHKFRQLKNGNIVKNKKFVKGNSINLSYKILTSFFKSLYKDFKINNKFEKNEYIRVIEPHKDFTPHLHAVVFVKTKYIDLFHTYYERKVQQNKNLGMYKFEVINDISRSASYILKYASKNFQIENDKFKIYYGWKLANKIRAYTFTRQFIPRDIFNKLSFYFSKDYVFDTESIEEFGTSNLYEMIHNFTQYQQDIINLDTGEVKSTEKVSNEDDMFIIQINKHRNDIKNCEAHKVFEVLKALLTSNITLVHNELEKYNLLNNFNFFIKEILDLNYLELKKNVYFFYVYLFLQTLLNKTRYQYKYDKYQIYKKHHSNCKYELVYNKEDWELNKTN